MKSLALVTCLLSSVFLTSCNNGPLSGAKILGLQDIEKALEEGVALVDVEQIFNSYYRKSVAQVEVDAVSAELNGRLQLARQVLTELLQRIETGRVGLEKLSETERAEKEKEIVQQIRQAQELNQRIQQTAQQYQRAIATRSAEMSAEIYKEIDDHISRIAQKEGYRMVVNKTAKDNNGLPIFPYVYDKRDLTTEIITAMNANRPPDVVVQADAEKKDAGQDEEKSGEAVVEVLKQVDDLADVIPADATPSEAAPQEGTD